MKKLTLYIIVVLISVACNSVNNDDRTGEKPIFSMYIGTYTDGDSEGIYKYALNADGMLDSIKLVAKSKNPSFLTLTNDNKYVIASSEVNEYEGNGAFELYRITDGDLEFINRCNTGGPHTCYVTVNKNGFAMAANYSGGNIGLCKIENDKLTDVLDVQQHTGSGTHSRQEAPHAHSVRFVPNSNDVIAVDLGTNELWFYDLDTAQGKLIPKEQTKLAMEPESGPRHLAFHPNGKWIYVLNELSGTVSLVTKDENEIYQLVNTTSSLPKDFAEFNKSADIHISSDGKFLYASNRGPNTIAIFSISVNGELSILGFESTRGGEPRNFALSPDENYLLVANQHSNNIISFKRNKETGLLTFVDEINAPAPVCVLFDK